MKRLSGNLKLTAATFALGVIGSLLYAGAAEPKVDISKLPPAARTKGVTYEKDIQPIFAKACFECHGPEKQKAKLRLDSREAVLKGSSEGKVVRERDSAKSLLVHAVARLDEDLAMPPEGSSKPLTKEVVGLIRAWIDQGAK